jgi:hypothetical protein
MGPRSSTAGFISSYGFYVSIVAEIIATNIPFAQILWLELTIEI